MGDWRQLQERLERALASSAAAMSTSAERVQEILAERAQHLSREAAPTAVGEITDLALFTVGTQRCAVRTRWVQGVYPPAEVTPLPGASAHILGIANLQGELLLVADLVQLMGVGTADAEADAQLLALGTGRPDLGFLLRGTCEFAAVDIAASMPAPETMGLSGVVTPDGLFVLDAEALLSDRRFIIDDGGTA